MGLVLGVWKNETIYVADDWFKVAEVTGPQEFVLENADGTAFTIEPRSEYEPGQEVIPEVFVRAAPARGNHPRFQARLYIDAPRDLLIMRQRAYEATDVLKRAQTLIDRLAEYAREDGCEDFDEEATQVQNLIEREIRKNERKNTKG